MGDGKAVADLSQKQSLRPLDARILRKPHERLVDRPPDVASRGESVAGVGVDEVVDLPVQHAPVERQPGDDPRVDPSLRLSSVSHEQLPTVYVDFKISSRGTLARRSVQAVRRCARPSYTRPVAGEADRVDGLIAQWSRERPDLDTSPLEVVARVARVSGHLDRAVDGWLAQIGLKWWELDVLGALRRSGPPFRLSPGELSERLMVTSGTMTTRLDRLEAKGLVGREPSARDRRGVVVSLTSEGHTCVDDAMDPHLANLERMLLPLDGDDREQIAGCLRRLLITLEGQARDGLDPPEPASAAEAD